MTHKQAAPFNGFPLPGWQVAEVAGGDAAAFLQAQLMNDVHALAPGRWQWNGWLNPKGRVIALFALVALDVQRYWLVVPDFPAPELVERLKRFVFRSKAALLARDDCRLFGAFAQPQRAHGSEVHRGMDADVEVVELDLGAGDNARSLRIETRGNTDDDVIASAAGNMAWAAFDLAHGFPHLSIAQIEAWTPQMLSLDRLAAYSLKKGCYPGQEIVARTHYLGQAKRGLARVAGKGLAVGAEIVADGRVLGSIVSIVSSIDDEALAVLSTDRPGDGWECAGVACRELPLLDGLAR